MSLSSQNSVFSILRFIDNFIWRSIPKWRHNLIVFSLILPGIHYGLNYPFLEYKTGRNLRMSPIFPKLKEAGAVFGQVMGYERPTWFDPTFAESK